MSVVLNTKHLSGFINEEEYKAIYPQVEAAHRQLEAKNGPGNDFLGWMYLPRDYDKEEFARIKEAAQKIREDSEVLVVAGIGGSYLGARAVIEAVKGLYHNEIENGLKIYFCGNSISPTYLNDIITLCKGKRFSINVISKSGTTTETSLAFRVLRKLLEDEMGVEEANKRIYATTDRAKGTLKQLADAQGWPTFVVPDDVGGRYSVLSAVGLLPIAAAGISIDKTRMLSVILSTWLGAIGILVYEQGFGFVQLYMAPFNMALPAVAAILIGGASVNKASITNVIIGTFLYQGLVTMTPTVMNGLFHMDMSEVIRIIVSNGMIVYALTRKTEGGKN